MSCQKFAACRPNDFFYDPLFIVSSKKDYYKAGYFAKVRQAKYAVCPIFSAMFSDMPNYPRIRYLMRKGVTIPPYVDKQNEGKRFSTKQEVESEINGANRYKYFAVSVTDTPIQEDVIVTTRKTESVLKDKTKTKQTQTKYRESSAQTHPWEPPYVVVDDSDPEILKLDFLKWGAGLPAGMHEIRMIERARMKRSWENALPPCTSKANVEERKQLIELMERDEWAFREKEIQDIQDLRLELLEQMLSELHEKSACRTEKKMKLFTDVVENDKNEKLAKLKARQIRDLRKLKMKHEGFTGKYKAVNIVEEFADPTSELYAPLMRHGSHPKRWHLIINPKEKMYRTQYIGVENMDTLPSWLEKATHMKDCTCIKLPGTRLCMRETKWTTPVLKHLYEELKNLRTQLKPICSLRVRMRKPLTPPITPEVECDDAEEMEGNIAIIRIQSILRGRASQTLIYSGRDRCRQLIEELKYTHALLEEDKAHLFEQRYEVKNQQREQELCLKNAAKLHEILSRLQGTIVGTLLDFLNKELHKLMEERKTHAMCLMAERERHRREAAEAGRRQKEIRRRKEHDEIFKQVVKIHQETVDLYLQDIITEGLEFVSEEQARCFVERKAAEIEEEIRKPLSSPEEQEEYIANLVHHFVLPEVEKQIIRDRNKLRQERHLKATHSLIYKTIETLPKPRPEGEFKVPMLELEEEQEEEEEREDVIIVELPKRSVEVHKDEDEDDFGKITPLFYIPRSTITSRRSSELKEHKYPRSSQYSGRKSVPTDERTTIGSGDHQLFLSPDIIKEREKWKQKMFRRTIDETLEHQGEEEEDHIPMPISKEIDEDFAVKAIKERDKVETQEKRPSLLAVEEDHKDDKKILFGKSVEEIPRYGSLTQQAKRGDSPRSSKTRGSKSPRESFHR